jgi:hypothetical protein
MASLHTAVQPRAPQAHGWLRAAALVHIRRSRQKLIRSEAVMQLDHLQHGPG